MYWGSLRAWKWALSQPSCASVATVRSRGLGRGHGRGRVPGFLGSFEGLVLITAVTILLVFFQVLRLIGRKSI